jgi:hypothetical protein
MPYIVASTRGRLSVASAPRRPQIRIRPDARDIIVPESGLAVLVLREETVLAQRESKD